MHIYIKKKSWGRSARKQLAISLLEWQNRAKQNKLVLRRLLRFVFGAVTRQEMAASRILLSAEVAMPIARYFNIL